MASNGIKPGILQLGNVLPAKDHVKPFRKPKLDVLRASLALKQQRKHWVGHFLKTVFAFHVGASQY
ncbi:hypothetical protein HAX54_010022, partial [Datura stramonium]|nr:hypothetical protein [Datura stramonium]